ncbi:hypothetical protein K2173_024259 [Erythroxylum novogranatense]|uniref:Centromere protein C n=1 Tax=Erythroxylum novogranatense TaxID=1862640 RepID=A0AAV8SUW7_9ROSI|nr:hypothetical protein K2173_024259 [Erythroxylum novogranatense]
MEDPLEAYSGLSLLQRTFASLSVQPPRDSDDTVVSAHNFLKCLPVKDPNKLLEQGKLILKSSMEEETVVEKGRRPGLERKRAPFSLLPSSSSLEPTLDIDKLKDPEDFFSAFERIQNAKKEIARQTSLPFGEPDQGITATSAPRPHRPGIPGRSRTAKYKHLYPSSASEDVPEEDFRPFNRNAEHENAHVDATLEGQNLEIVESQQMQPLNVATQEVELAVSVTKAENRVNKLLEELLAHDYNELDGDGALSLLQNRLQIKSLDIKKLNFPEFEDIQQIHSKASGGKLPKPVNVLVDIQNFLQLTRVKTPLKQTKAESSVATTGSPTRVKSPLASFSLLSKRILQSNTSRNPFSTADIDQSPPIHASPTARFNQSSDSREFCAEMEHTSVGSDDGDINENLSQPNTDTDVHTNGPNGIVDLAEDIQQEGVACQQPDLNMDDSAVGILNDVQHLCDQSDPMISYEHAMDGISKTQDSEQEQVQDAAPVQQNEKIMDSSVETRKEQTMNKSRPSKGLKRKASSRRQSLAAAGTTWENGVRKSTRIKSRPLEYWKGERFLYGRIHGSLPTVIGKKVKSFASDEYQVFSYVTPEYQELLDLAALY